MKKILFGFALFVLALVVAGCTTDSPTVPEPDPVVYYGQFRSDRTYGFVFLQYPGIGCYVQNNMLMSAEEMYNFAAFCNEEFLQCQSVVIGQTGEVCFKMDCFRFTERDMDGQLIDGTAIPIDFSFYCE